MEIQLFFNISVFQIKETVGTLLYKWLKKNIKKEKRKKKNIKNLIVQSNAF